jgi:hypothetical protein
MLGFLLGFAASTVAVAFGYWRSRKFVSERLRYVDAIHNPAIPIVAAIGAGAIAMPVVAILPIVGAGTAIAFGLSVGLGVAAGRADIRRSLPPAS